MWARYGCAPVYPDTVRLAWFPAGVTDALESAVDSAVDSGVHGSAEVVSAHEGRLALHLRAERLGRARRRLPGLCCGGIGRLGRVGRLKDHDHAKLHV